MTKEQAAAAAELLAEIDGYTKVIANLSGIQKVTVEFDVPRMSMVDYYKFDLKKMEQSDPERELVKNFKDTLIAYFEGLKTKAEEELAQL